MGYQICDFFISKFSESFFLNPKKASYIELQGFGYSYMEARIAKPGKTLTSSNYCVANYKLNKKKLNLNVKMEKSLTIAICDIA